MAIYQNIDQCGNVRKDNGNDEYFTQISCPCPVCLYSYGLRCISTNKEQQRPPVFKSHHRRTADVIIADDDSIHN